ncbi:MAG: YceI family protein [Salibacteraceae bacterium]
MKINKISILAIASILAVSCASEPKEDTHENATPVEKATEKVCTYSYDASSTKLSWKSFKTSAKVAVGGTFDTYEVHNTIASNSESAVFENATFTIVTSSVNSGNEERDPKLVDYFFKSMVSTDTISGKVVKISEAVEGKGAAIISLTLNGETHEENAVYTLEGTVLTLSATLKMEKWNASNAIAALNKACELLHTGDDGVSQLWDEVDVEISTELAKTCE